MYCRLDRTLIKANVVMKKALIYLSKKNIKKGSKSVKI